MLPTLFTHLVLATLSGTIVNVSVSVAKYDRLEDLEDHVVDCLASVADLTVFGRTIDFLHAGTQTYLVDPIWDQLRQNAEYCIIFRDCIEVLHSQEGLEGCHSQYSPRGPRSSESRDHGVRRCFCGSPQSMRFYIQERRGRSIATAQSGRLEAPGAFVLAVIRLKPATRKKDRWQMWYPVSAFARNRMDRRPCPSPSSP